MIGTPSWFLGVVADSGKLGLSIDDDHHGVQIEDEAGSRPGKGKEFGSELIVENHKLPDCLGGNPFEKASEGGLVRKSGQSQKREESSVVLENFGFVDSPHSCNDGVEKRKNQIGRKVLGLSLRDLYKILYQPSKAKFVAKTLNQNHSTEVCEAMVFEG